MRGGGKKRGLKRERGRDPDSNPLDLKPSGFAHVSPLASRPDVVTQPYRAAGHCGPSVSATHTLPPPPSGAFVLPPLLPFSSSSTPPKQNFFKCLIFPPFGFLFASALSLVCPSIFHPSPAAAPLRLLPVLLLLLLPLFLSPLPPALRLHLPSPSRSPLLLMQTDLFIYFKLVAQVICGR